MFHYKDNLFFGRMNNGSVRIIKFAKPPKDWPQAEGFYTSYEDAVLFDVIVDADSWCSVISSVSAGGEWNNGFYKAKEFHG
jgi:hypothetical protein